MATNKPTVRVSDAEARMAHELTERVNDNDAHAVIDTILNGYANTTGVHHKILENLYKLARQHGVLPTKLTPRRPVA